MFYAFSCYHVCLYLLPIDLFHFSTGKNVKLWYVAFFKSYELKGDFKLELVLQMLHTAPKVY